MDRTDNTLAWAAAGQALFEQAVARCSDLRGPSRLPGWSRGHVVTHVARNAEGLVRLLTWARTGIETPMYPSMEARVADIEAGAGRSPGEQLDDVRSAGAAFAAAARELSAQHWDAIVGTRRGPVPASTVPWLRVREVWLHLVDLDSGAELDVLPGDIATELVRDVAGWMHSRVSTRIEMQIPGEEAVTFGPEAGAPEAGTPEAGAPEAGTPEAGAPEAGTPEAGAPEAGTPVRVSGPVQELAGWLTGRSRGDRLIAPDGLPELPSWI